ncbi:unnamed protein product [Acanthoscelides obtectus]|uniref:Uncharacterized protein n=1 Tax=Acanthoscelides obtectus TaxID=200917 RepID=A0A9P0LB64_ACAOB|nr:unnamed protein product [Acanthoscelides obtectus]CAK1669869.1 hypothetical protein AOBTE_LOCUS27284 [Acanthoscelides obtectus]
MSDEVVKFLEKEQQDDEIFHDSISTEQEVCRNISCLNKYGDLRVARCEVKMQNRLIGELQQSNKSLNRIISLLQTQHNSEVIQNHNNTSYTQSCQNGSTDGLSPPAETRGEVLQ